MAKNWLDPQESLAVAVLSFWVRGVWQDAIPASEALAQMYKSQFTVRGFAGQAGVLSGFNVINSRWWFLIASSYEITRSWVDCKTLETHSLQQSCT